MKRIGCIGLGAIGLPTARHLAKRFGPVRACDVAPGDAARSDPLLRFSAHPAEVASSCDLVFVCLPSEKASLAVVDGPHGLLSAAHDGLTVVELSTLDPETARDIGTRYAAKGVAFCDAPVFGTPAHARDGQLAVVVSGQPGHYEAVRPVIEGFSRRVTYAGALGSASLIKVMQNSLGLVQVMAIAEAFTVLEAAGGNPHAFYEAVVGSEGMSDSPLFTKVGIDLADHRARFGALLRIGAKDIRLGDRVARRAGVSADFIARAAAEFDTAEREGFADADLMSVVAAIRHAGAPTS